MIPPLGFLRVFVAGFHVEHVVRWPFLVRARREHGDDGETDGFDGQSGRPIIREDGKADVAVAIDVRMDGHVGPEEDNDRRVERIAFGEFEGKLEQLAIVERGSGAFEIDGPFSQVVARLVDVDGDTGGRIRA